MKRDINSLLDSLSHTKFRGSFHLNDKMKEYVKVKGLDKIEEDAKYFVIQRLGDARPKNDGKQTPMRQVHPVFVAQHATGTCCRSCLNRIHGIGMNKELDSTEIEYVVKVIMTWIKRNI